MAVVSRKKWKVKQQSIIILLLLTIPCLHGPPTVFAVSSSYTSSVSEANMERSTALQIIVIIPTMFGLGDPQWKKGEESLLGAQLAIKEINEASDLLSGHRLEVIPIQVPRCELSEGIVPFVEELTSNHNNIVGIVSYFCNTIAQLFSQIAHSWITHVVQISATSITVDSSPHLHHSILPLRESIHSATIHLMQSFGWKRIAVISSRHPSIVDSTRAFLRNAKGQGIQIATHIETFLSPTEYLQELQRYGIKIIVAFIPQSEAVDILCAAYFNGFKWPDYAWVFADISKPNIFNDYCQAEAINNVIFLDLARAKFNPQDVLPSGLNYSAYHEVYLEKLEKSSVELNISLQSNPYASVLYDSIWAVALTINRSLSVLNERNLSLTNIHQDTGFEIMDVLEEQLSQLSFQGATGWLNFSHSAAAAQTSIDILQVQNGQPVQIGSYYHSLNQLTLNKTVLGLIPSHTLDRKYILYPIAVTVIMLFLVSFCLILTTISMCLFIYYRNEPAIKATSNTLSLCMFVGSYILLAASLIHAITSGTIVYSRNESLRTFVCMFSVSCTNIGMDIVLAAVIAKTLRIYHIFKTFGKVSRIFSDPVLFLLISGLASVKIPMLIAWASLDAAHLVDVEQLISTTVPPFIQVKQECRSRGGQGFWLIPLFSYSVFLGLIMVLLAVLTRKIKRKDYKDSKKINILVVALIINASIFSPLWIVFRIISATILSRLAYNIGTMACALLCQVLLILPKTVPLVTRNFQCLHIVNWTFPRKKA